MNNIKDTQEYKKKTREASRGVQKDKASDWSTANPWRYTAPLWSTDSPSRPKLWDLDMQI